MTPRRRDQLLARALLATKGVDRAYRLFDRARSRVVARWTPPGVVGAFNAIAYGSDDVYDPTATNFRTRLFPWEAAAVREHFPPPPATLLVGGAGGGREPFALAERGYEVVAFEPAAGLAAAMADRAAQLPLVRAFRGGYEDLPLLHPARPGDPGARVDELPPFAAAVMGWGSFSHLMTREARLGALRAVAGATAGPVLVSFLSFDEDQPAGAERDTARFSIFIGWYHTVGSAELRALAAEAGLDVVALNTDETDSTWPHAILRRR